MVGGEVTGWVWWPAVPGADRAVGGDVEGDASSAACLLGFGTAWAGVGGAAAGGAERAADQAGLERHDDLGCVLLAEAKLAG